MQNLPEMNLYATLLSICLCHFNFQTQPTVLREVFFLPCRDSITITLLTSGTFLPLAFPQDTRTRNWETDLAWEIEAFFLG